MKKIIVILGPTASGKSSLAKKLAKRFNGEIISADSRQIYKEMDIGTNKDKKAYLVDIINPNQEFSLAQYKKLAIKTIKDIHKRGKIPFLVGGTGLYIQAIVDNLDIPQVKPDFKLRKKIEKEIEKKGLEAVYQKLIKLDPQAEKFIDPKNPRRIIRALEVCLLTGQPFSKSRKKGQPLFNILQIGLKMPQENLNKKIGQRAEQMLSAGLINEVQNLLKKYSSHLPCLSGIGYKEIIDFLHGKITLDKAKEIIKLHTRQYAKRQMTWLKKIPDIKWIKTNQQANKLIKNFLK